MGVDIVTLSDGKVFRNPYIGRSHPDKNGIMHSVYRFEYANYYYYRDVNGMHFLSVAEL